jgi:small subunit ribosomal protein S3
MGQKVNPISLRLGITKTWNSLWYADTNYAALLHGDLRVRQFLKKKLAHASVSRITIERMSKRMRVLIHTARPGIVIGKKGVDLDRLRKDVMQITGLQDVSINLVEVRKPEIDATLIAESVAQQLERRVAFRKAMNATLAYKAKKG